MIKNVIFDIGKVLLSYEPYEYVMSFGYNKELSKKIYNIVFEDNRWLNLDRGTMTDEEYVNILIEENPNYTNEIKETFNNWFTMLKPMQTTVDFYIKLKELGYNIYLLSNFSDISYNKAEKKYNFLNLANGKIISYAVKTVKPEKKIYELLISKYNLIPEECIFIDDRIENILMANEFGINTIHFIDIDTTISKFGSIISN